MKNTHYGDEDAECEEPEPEELFETARFMGWKPEDMRIGSLPPSLPRG